MGQFPFGAPVLPCGTDLPKRPYEVLVLGAYPSALHVRWTPPAGYGPAVAALPVDNEPTPFWAGEPEDVTALFAAWRARWFNPRWGAVAPAALNGPSGRDLERGWLTPLGHRRVDAFITDCLPTARASTGVAARLADRYRPVVEALDAPDATLGAHPDEQAIVAEALDRHADRLNSQVRAADPDLLITLGNAAARVVAALAELPDKGAVLRPETYGRERQVVLAGRTRRWQALVHPAAPRTWADRHRTWVGSL